MSTTSDLEIENDVRVAKTARFNVSTNEHVHRYVPVSMQDERNQSSRVPV